MNPAHSLRLIMALTLAVVSPVSAQTVVSQGVTGNYTNSSGAVVFPNVTISSNASPGMVLLTNGSSDTPSSLTINSITGASISGAPAYYYFPLYGLAVQGGGGEGVEGYPGAMNGPTVTLTNSATLAGNWQTANLPANTSWGFSTIANTINTFGSLSGASLGANAWGNGSTNGVSSGGNGGSVTIDNAGTLYVAPPPNYTSFSTSGLPWQPYMSALAAISIGGNALTGQASTTNGGNGGAVSVTTEAGSTIVIYGNNYTNTYSPSITVNGITALSQGGSNGYNCSGTKGSCSDYAFSSGGWGGGVNVTLNGNLKSVGSYGNALNGEIGVAAASLGASFITPGGSYGTTMGGQSGVGGNVSVTLGSTASIALNQGSAIGVEAISASGSTTGADPLTDRSGTVSVIINQGASISTGNAAARFSMGVVAVSTGNPLFLEPFNTNAIGGSGGTAPGPVSVTNSGSISTTGEMGVGIAALSVGAGGMVTQVSSNGAAYLGSTSGGNSGGSGTVDVTNNGTIVTDGASSFGIVAFSGTQGGLVEADGNAVLNGTSVTSGLVVGNSSGNSTGSTGGTVTVSNGGWIYTGDTNAGGNMSIGIVAQSIGGGGGSSGGQGAAAFVGDGGGAGGSGGAVNVWSSGPITTLNDGAIGILAQSVGGGGGNGGNAKGLFVAVGGQGGSGGNGGPVNVVLYSGGQTTTSGDFAHGVLEQSIGGGGGNGGYAKAYGEFIATGIGGAGGSGGSGGQVTFTNGSSLLTTGEQSYGALLQSVGGGGGNGGAANAYSVGVAFSASVAVGGSGGSGGIGGAVSATNTGTISTAGPDAIGLLAQSIGGGGGNAGSALAKSLAFGVPGEPEIPTISASVSIGGAGGATGAGNTVTVVSNAGTIATQGNGAIGILAQSIGGGGGNGGDSTAQAHAVEAESPTLKMGVAIGGSGSGGGDGGSVSVTNECQGCSGPGAWITTVGNNATGILAQSIGGGGGNGGTGNTGVGSPNLGGDTGTSVSVTYGMGGSGGGGGNGGSVAVLNADAHSFITTVGSGSQGILAQSIGGGGGNGSGGAASGSSDTVNVNISVGGSGGTAGVGGSVSVTNLGNIFTGAAPTSAVPVTTGGDSVGILAQSIGGGGGTGGSSDAAAAIGALGTFENYLNVPSSTNYAANVAVGGKGGGGGSGGTVSVVNDGLIVTYGERAHGTLAQSIGGGGGSGGAVDATPNGIVGTIAGNIPQPSPAYSASVSVGGSGGSGGNGGVVNVTNNGTIVTAGYAATGILAESIGNGGGVGAEGTVNDNTTFNIGLSVTGTSGNGGNGGAVTVTNTGAITTVGDDAPAILAQSIGGGGGVGSGGCTNSASAGAAGVSATACIGNTASLTGSSQPWADQSQFVVKVGGGAGNSGSGGAVTVNVDGAIVTTGARSMGVVAQNIAGGGGYFSASSQNISSLSMLGESGSGGANFATSNPTGSTSNINVAVNVGAGGSITTSGAGGWGILAQSIGGGGGFEGDPSLQITSAPNWYQANTLQFATSNKGYADGGNVSIVVDGSIVTKGAFAHGIVAQSIGGGGGIQDYTGANLYNMPYLSIGNSGQINGTGPGTYSGTGYTINVAVPAGGSIATYGAGSIGIFAQSSGNNTYTRAITVTIGGSVMGGTGPNAAGVMLIGGANQSNPSYSGVNTITINPGGSLGTFDGTAGTAITTNYGYTNVINNGTITGSINLGSTPGDITNNGVLNAGSTIVVASNTFTNNGTLNIGGNGSIGTTNVSGGFHQTGTGILRIDVNSLAAQRSDVLNVSGRAQIDGTIIPTATALLPGAMTIVTAGNAASTATIAHGPVFGWNTVASGVGLSLAPSSNFRPQGAALTSTQGSLADYLTRAWNNSDAFLAGQFAAFSQMQNVNQYTSALNAIAGQQHTSQPQWMANSSMAILGSAMSCPVFVAAGTVLGEDSCVWGKVTGGLANAYSNGNNPGYDVSSVTTRIGGQKEIAQDWFLGGAFGAGQNWGQGSSFSSQGQTYDGSVSLKHTMGPWIIAGSMAIANGSFQNSRLFSLPAVGSIPGSSSLLKSDSSTLLAGGRLRAAYDFAFSDWYVRPYGDVDVVYTHMPSFQESGSGGLPLAFSASNKTSFILSPMVEIGGRHNIDETTILRPFIEFGMSILPDNQRTLNARLVGAAPADGTFTTYSNAPNALGRINLGVQLYQIGGWEVKGEYGIAAGSNYLAQTGSARVAYHF